MKKVFIIAVAAIVVSCGNKQSSQQSQVPEDSVSNASFIAVVPAIEGATQEAIVNSIAEANTARFTIAKDNEEFSVSLEPGNKATALLHSSEIRNQLFQGKWEIKDNQYVVSLGMGDTDGSDIIVTIPNTMESAKVKAVATGKDDDYKLDNLFYFKIEKETSSKDNDALAIEKINEFYKNYVFAERGAGEDVIKKYCTKKLAKKLADDYEYEGGGYAIWDFRSGYQDGESDIQTVEKIETLGDGKYKVFYNDWGSKGYCIISVVSEGDNILFDEIENSIK